MTHHTTALTEKSWLSWRKRRRFLNVAASLRPSVSDHPGARRLHFKHYKMVYQRGCEFPLPYALQYQNCCPIKFTLLTVQRNLFFSLDRMNAQTTPCNGHACLPGLSIHMGAFWWKLSLQTCVTSVTEWAAVPVGSSLPV